MHAQGQWNKPDDSMWPWWVSNKSYQVGDKVQFSGYNYTCVTANSDVTFDSSKWTNEGEASTGEIAFVIGNGINTARSNALTVNWDGTQKIAGDLYTNYDFDTNTGNKVATEAYVTEAIAGAGGGGSDEYALKTDTVLNTTLSMGRRAGTTVGQHSVALGDDLVASGDNSHAEGSNTQAIGTYSHAEGTGTTASGSGSHAEGYNTSASGVGAHAEGSSTTASGPNAHAEGGRSRAIGPQSHAEGTGSQAVGNESHAEGGGAQATGDQSHAEGAGSRATGAQSHAEGSGTTASGQASHAEGVGTQATSNQSHAEGGGT